MQPIDHQSPYNPQPAITFTSNPEPVSRTAILPSAAEFRYVASATEQRTSQSIAKEMGYYLLAAFASFGIYLAIDNHRENVRHRTLTQQAYVCADTNLDGLVSTKELAAMYNDMGILFVSGVGPIVEPTNGQLKAYIDNEPARDAKRAEELLKQLEGLLGTYRGRTSQFPYRMNPEGNLQRKGVDSIQQELDRLLGNEQK